MRTLGLVTIGQSPRDDMRDEIRAAAGTSVQIVEGGALDHLSHSGIAALGPTHPADVLVTRLRDGTQVTVGEEAVLPFLEDAISEVEGAGADFTLVVCTGAFPSLRHANPLLFAGPLLTAGVTALATGLTVDIFCPDGQQIDAVRDKWQTAHVTVGTLHVASPYRDAERALRDAARAVGDPNFIVLDCMGYTEAMAETVQADTGIPTIPARRVVARLAGLLT